MKTSSAHTTDVGSRAAAQQALEGRFLPLSFAAPGLAPIQCVMTRGQFLAGWGACENDEERLHYLRQLIANGYSRENLQGLLPGFALWADIDVAMDGVEGAALAEGDAAGVSLHDDAEDILNEGWHSGGADAPETVFVPPPAQGKFAAQMRRAANALTGPKTYDGNTNIAYVTDGDGNINFNAPLNQAQLAARGAAVAAPPVISPNIVRGALVTDLNSTAINYYNGLSAPQKTAFNLNITGPVGAGDRRNLGRMPAGAFVNLRLASRAQHFAIADSINDKPDGYTWHHLTNRFEMVPVKTTVHSKHGHNGGFLLWP